MNWFKRLFPAPEVPPEVVPVTEVEALIAESQALGAQIDELRERRRQIKLRIEALEVIRVASLPKGVTIGGK